MNQPTTPEPVSPAPDTEALRQQVAAIASEYLHACPHCPKGQPEWVAGEDQVHEIVGQVVTELAAENAMVRHWLTQAQEVRDEEVIGARTARSERDEARTEVAGLRADLDQARTEVERLETLVLEKHELIQGWARYGERVKAERAKYGDMLIDVLGITGPVGRWFEQLVPQACAEIERLRAELAGARTIPDDAAELEVIDERDSAEEWADRLAYAIAPPEVIGEHSATNNPWANALERLSTPTTDPAPAPEQTNPSQSKSSGTVPQRFPATDVQTNAGPAPAAADGLREEYAGFFHPAWPDPLHFQYGDNPRANAARWYAEHVEQQPQIEVRRRVLSDWVTVDVTAPAAPQAPAGPTKSSNAHGQINTDALAAREDAATPDASGHAVQVSVSPIHDDLAVAMCQEAGCEANVSGRAQDVEDWADAHHADTLRPGPVAPIRHEEE